MAFAILLPTAWARTSMTLNLQSRSLTAAFVVLWKVRKIDQVRRAMKLKAME